MSYDTDFDRQVLRAPQELKYVDTYRVWDLPNNYSAGELDPNPQNCLNAVAQGSTSTTRLGDSYVIKCIHVSGRLFRARDSSESQAPISMQSWIALLVDMQTNGVQLESEYVFDHILHGIGLFRNMDYLDRFEVLAADQQVWDTPPMVWNGSAIMTGETCQRFEFKVDCEIPVNCSGSTNNVSDVLDNSVHLIGGCTDASAPNEVTIEYNARVYFVDA